jgi:hypothetical protein
VPRWVLGVVHSDPIIVPRSGNGARRRKPRSLLARLSRIDVLVIDDGAMAPLSEPERRDFWEICEERYQVRSTILTSQLPVSRWRGILSRLVHNAHRIEIRGDSMRKNPGEQNPKLSRVATTRGDCRLQVCEPLSGADG